MACFNTSGTLGKVGKFVLLVQAYRIVVFIPEGAEECILQAVLALDDLQYGSYKGVSWTAAAGIERFTPEPDASPTLGGMGEQVRAPVVRVEFSIPRDNALLQSIIDCAIYPNHPWEEPVISVSETIETRKNATAPTKP